MHIYQSCMCHCICPLKAFEPGSPRQASLHGLWSENVTINQHSECYTRKVRWPKQYSNSHLRVSKLLFYQLSDRGNSERYVCFIHFKCTRDSRDNLTRYIYLIQSITKFLSSWYPDDDFEIQSKHCTSRISSVKLSQESLVHLTWIKSRILLKSTFLVDFIRVN